MAALSSPLYDENEEAEENEEDGVRDWVIAFYQQHNPEKLSSVDTILAKFKGKEDELVRQLERKYGTSEECQRIKALERELDQSHTALLREQRAKEEALLKLSQVTASEQIEREQKIQLFQSVQKLDTMVAGAVADAATALFALQQREEMLANLAKRQQELTAHLIASSQYSLNNEKLKEKNSECNEDTEFKALYFSTKRELATLALRCEKAENRCIQLSRQRAQAIRELGEANRRFDAVTGSAEHSRKLVQDARAEIRREASAKECAEAALAAQSTKIIQLENALKNTQNELISTRAARTEILNFCTTERDRLENETAQALSRHAEQYLMAQEDILAANADIEQRVDAICTIRLHNANTEINRLTLALDQAKRERESALETKRQLEVQLERAADRIVHAEHLLHTMSPSKKNKNGLPSSSSSQQLLESLLVQDTSEADQFTPRSQQHNILNHQTAKQHQRTISVEKRTSISVASTPLVASFSNEEVVDIDIDVDSNNNNKEEEQHVDDQKPGEDITEIYRGPSCSLCC